MRNKLYLQYIPYFLSIPSIIVGMDLLLGKFLVTLLNLLTLLSFCPIIPSNNIMEDILKDIHFWSTDW